jgi:adenylate cyclase
VPRTVRGRRTRSPDATLETALASYVDPQVVRHLLSGGRAPLLSGVRRTASCLFADIRGFTRFAARADPARVVALLDRFFASASRIAIEHGGSIDKLIGDAIMVMFGVPRRQRDGRARALATAIAMVEAFEAAIADVVATPGHGRPRLGLGAGIATGPVVLANVGSTARMDYTAVGATVNLAARLCAEARAREVLCDAATAHGVGVRASTIRALRVKGIGRVVRAHAFAVRARSETTSMREEIDPVCGMKVSRASGHERRYRERTYWFCSAGCRARFTRNPRRYAGCRRPRSSRG